MPAIATRWEKVEQVIEPQINAEGTHVHPFDPSFPIDVRFLNMQRCTTVRMNRHHYFELVCATEGRTTMQIQDRFFSVRVGDLVVIGSDLYHRVMNSPNSQSQVTVLFFEPELICGSEGKGEEMEYLMPFLAQDSEFPHVVPAKPGLAVDALGLMQRICAELPAKTARGRLTVKTYLKMILIQLANHYSAYLTTRKVLAQKRAHLERLQPLFDYLEKHCGSPVMVKDAARLCAMSSSHFMYSFKLATGQSFCSYLNHFRVAKAQFLLATTDIPIASISVEVGFCCQSYFGLVFRKLVGVTPLAYRCQSSQGN